MNVQPTPPEGVPERRDGPQDRRNQGHLERVLTKALTAFVVVGLSCAAAIFGFGFVLREIQQQRFDSLVQTCQETNQRNQKVNAEIDSAINNLPEQQTKEQEAGTAAFRLIIEAAVPYTDDCHAYASERVKGYF